MHDAGRSPGWQDGIDYGYITLSTLKNLGEQPIFNELHVSLTEQSHNKTHIANVAITIKSTLDEHGYTISSIYIPEPGVHPHTDQMNSLLFLLEAFGFLTLLLSSILVYNNISTLLSREIKQIGIMKAIGGQTNAINKIYLYSIGKFCWLKLR